MDIFLTSTLTWTADPDASAYQLIMVPAGAGFGGTRIGEILDHTLVAGSTAGSVSAETLINGGTEGTSYDIHIRGTDSSGNFSAWSSALNVTVRLSLVDTVVDLTIS